MLNITPQLTHLGPRRRHECTGGHAYRACRLADQSETRFAGTLCFLRGIFTELVATKPTSFAALRTPTHSATQFAEAVEWRRPVQLLQIPLLLLRDLFRIHAGPRRHDAARRCPHAPYQRQLLLTHITKQQKFQLASR